MRLTNNIGFQLVFSFVLAFCLTRDASASTPNDLAVPLPPPIKGQNYHLIKNWDFSRNVLSLDDLHKDFLTRYSSE